ncbi:hypothetical protein [Pantoea phage Nafs113]|nr:hypothetical protein [Pantoea phage Nafs113]
MSDKEHQSTTDIQHPNTILGAGAEADIPQEHRDALNQKEKPFEAFTQREQIQILHTQVDNLRTSFAFLSESLIQQAGALQCAMGILKQIKPEWTIVSQPVKGGLRWLVVGEDGKPVEGIFDKVAEESREAKPAEDAE